MTLSRSNWITLAALIFLATIIMGYWNGARGHELVIASTYNDGTRDPNGNTAAHKTLPFGTRLTVSHGHRKMVVMINDRGPFVRGRTLDLTPAANKYLRCGGLCRIKMEPWPPLPRSRPIIPDPQFAWGAE